MPPRQLPDHAADDPRTAYGHEGDAGFAAPRSAVRHFLNHRITRPRWRVFDLLLVTLPEPEEHRSSCKRCTSDTDGDPRAWSRSHVLGERSFRLDPRSGLDRGFPCFDFSIELCLATCFDRGPQDGDTALDVLTVRRLGACLEVAFVCCEGFYIASHSIGNGGNVVQ